MRHLIVCTLVLVLVSAAATAAEVDRQGEKRLQTELRFGWMILDNFFQAPDGNPQEDVSAGAAEVRLNWQFKGDRRLQAYSHLEVTSYDEFGESPGITAGLRNRGRPQTYNVFARLQRDRPTVDVGDRFDEADVFGLHGEYSYRLTRDWQVSGRADFQRQTFELFTGNDNHQYGIGGAVRYRGFGYSFSPEAGVILGKRDADDPNEDLDQEDLYLKLRFLPAPPIYLSVRYRYRMRDYSIADPTGVNFGREDRRQQWTLTADFKTWSYLTWNLYYAYQDADSTLPSRIFTTHILRLGVTLGL